MSYYTQPYDPTQLEPQEESVTYPVCPLCWAVLDGDEDEIYTDSDDPSVVTGCSHCMKTYDAQKWWEQYHEAAGL